MSTVSVPRLNDSAPVESGSSDGTPQAGPSAAAVGFALSVISEVAEASGLVTFPAEYRWTEGESKSGSKPDGRLQTRNRSVISGIIKSVGPLAEDLKGMTKVERGILQGSVQGAFDQIRENREEKAANAAKRRKNKKNTATAS